MRGIAGIIHFDRRPLVEEAVERLARAMPLGPVDRLACWQEGAAGLAHCLKRSLPEDSFESQPLRSSDGDLILVTDAMLDNRDDLAAAFGWSADEARVRPDSAFVLRAYETWREECPRHLDGKFALAVWHVRERRLFCAVDHFSFRPLYYWRNQKAFAFASTLRGLLSLPEIGRDIDDEVLADFLCRTGAPAGRTFYRQIASLPAAHRLQIEGSRTEVTRYWQPDPQRELRLGADADYLEAFRGELERAVSAGLRVDGTIGMMLSGGLDSSAIAAVAARTLQSRGRRLQAFHELPPGNDPRRAPLREHDESRYVRLWQAQAPHVDFHFIPPPPPHRISLEKTWDLFAVHGVPLGRFAAEQEASATPTVDRMLYGLAGNYVISLEAYPSVFFASLAVQGSWIRLARELAGHRRFYGRSIRHLLRARVLQPLLPSSGAGGWRKSLLPFLSRDFVARTDLAGRIKDVESAKRRRGGLDLRQSLAAIMTDLMPQTTGIVGSVINPTQGGDGYSPFFSRRLNEFCLAVPVDQQIRAGHDRLLLRRAMRGLLPDEVIWRASRGFPAPHTSRAFTPFLQQLPGMLHAIEGSSLAAAFIDLDHLRQFATAGASPSVQPARLAKLASTAVFLSWLERQGPIRAADPASPPA